MIRRSYCSCHGDALSSHQPGHPGEGCATIQGMWVTGLDPGFSCWCIYDRLVNGRWSQEAQGGGEGAGEVLHWVSKAHLCLGAGSPGFKCRLLVGGPLPLNAHKPS